MKRECETCIKRKNNVLSSYNRMMATDDMPHYQNRIMLLKENEELKKQQKEFVNYLEQCIENEKYCYMAEKQEDRVRQDIFQKILSKYKEIVGENNE